jgi:hypothetical protein
VDKSKRRHRNQQRQDRQDTVVLLRNRRARECTSPKGITLDTVCDDDPRLIAMRQFRNTFWDYALTSRRAALQRATSDVYTKPPDPYALALDWMKGGVR